VGRGIAGEGLGYRDEAVVAEIGKSVTEVETGGGGAAVEVELRFGAPGGGEVSMDGMGREATWDNEVVSGG
jgi:hypothetical protein